MKRTTKQSRMSIPTAYKAWKAGAPLAPLARRAGRTLRGPFRKLAGNAAAFRKAHMAHKRARKQQK